MKVRGILLILAAAAALSAVSCITEGAWPELRQDLHATALNGTLAVVAGQRTRHCARLAELITSALAKSPASGGLTLLSQDEVARRMGVYPSNVDDDALLSEQNLDGSDFSAAHLAACAGMQKKLKADYLLLVWFQAFEFFRTETDPMPGKGGTTNDHFVFVVCGRLIKYPENAVVGYFRFDYNRMINPFFVNLSMTDFLEKTLEETAGYVSAPIMKSNEPEPGKM
ncbi:MAG: hypothetical protein JXD23_09565 [Spirochaetales bacterium]|nr:hypothetical protein [Spirochaetales bacterium]